MKNSLLITLIFSVLALVHSCRDISEINISFPEPSNFELNFNIPNSIYLKEIVVAKKVNEVWLYSDPDWHIRSVNLENNIKFISYGIVPLGFEETAKAIDLVPGVMYEINIFWNSALGSIRFNINNEGYTEVLESKFAYY